MKNPAIYCLLILILVSCVIADRSSARQSERINPELLENGWDAFWVMHPTASSREYGVFHFRKVFEINTVPESYLVHVSGDTRYRFFVNGVSVSTGPAVGDRHNWRFETVDIAEHLESGENVVSATVWNFDEYNALAHHSYRTAFLLQGNSEEESAINTGKGWKVFQNEGYSPIPVSYQDVAGYYAAPHGEHFRAEAYPWGWRENEFDDSTWEDVRLYAQAQPRGTELYGGFTGGT